MPGSRKRRNLGSESLRQVLRSRCHGSEAARKSLLPNEVELLKAGDLVPPDPAVGDQTAAKDLQLVPLSLVVPDRVEPNPVETVNRLKPERLPELVAQDRVLAAMAVAGMIGEVVVGPAEVDTQAVAVAARRKPCLMTSMICRQMIQS